MAKNSNQAKNIVQQAQSVDGLIFRVKDSKHQVRFLNYFAAVKDWSKGSEYRKLPASLQREINARQCKIAAPLTRRLHSEAHFINSLRKYEIPRKATGLKFHSIGISPQSNYLLQTGVIHILFHLMGLK